MAGAVPLIVYGVATAAMVVAKVIESNAATDAQDAQYDLDIKQANELLAREQINEDLMIKQAGEMSKHSSYLSGAKGTGNTGLGVRMRIHEGLQQSLYNARREAQFKASMIKAGADINQELTSALKLSTGFSIGSTILGSAYNAYKSLDLKSDNEKDLVIAGANKW